MTTPRLQPRRADARSGFTLLEMLAVIVILGILMVVFLPRLLGTQKMAKEQIAKAFLVQLAGAIGEYEQKFGDYPPSTWPDKWGAPPNNTNVGAEALVQALWSNDWGGTTLEEQNLGNTDDDESKRPLGRLATSKLFEIKDGWDNPIAYIHRRDYGKQTPYATIDTETSEIVETNVGALQNPETKTYFRPTSFQLVSAGADGRFGTEDDLTNWKEEGK
jgi:prepilin-type N-terminal cleavage/methylation domain-containing protein